MARHRHVASETQSQFAVEEYRGYVGVSHTICPEFFQISRIVIVGKMFESRPCLIFGYALKPTNAGQV